MPELGGALNMHAGWTGGQFSVVRAAVGLHLLALACVVASGGSQEASNSAPSGLLAALVSPGLVALLLAAAAVGVVVGVATRPLAVASGCVLAWWADRRATAAVFPWPPAQAAGLPPLMPTLAALAALAAARGAPYGSWPARVRVDPRGDFSVAPASTVLAWAVVVMAYANGLLAIAAAWPGGDTPLGLRALGSPLGGLFLAGVAALAAPVTRAAIWHASFVAQIAAAALAASGIDGSTSLSGLGASLGLAILHLVAFEPQWVPACACAPVAPGSTARDRVLYDGDCGLCHRFLRLVMAEAQRSTLPFVFTPLQSPLCKRLVLDSGLYDEAKAGPLPDSVLVVTADGRLLMKSAAAFYVMQRLGGMWRVIGELGMLLPQNLRDFGYESVASVRHMLFAKPKTGACPLLPKPYRSAFDLGDDFGV
ncbi:uncharacterized protein AMSG_04431 [Thecamonas trahens ATCC 50062]|uniref:DUF393 domain-containing protein n=1 Tax=Thecamonas trahens ATCC 50062 TaxID=461836 RepID=A0A0L0D747_THETB|nr:hypothetical protein AMSG_04431 [Thecamonas trahens ATCC 50062]KNC48202.1 hypothetical protein AMSG_04431 [Thecamonas trahens ATCC 50062]|eukprot:XP_013758771.1 hypothetical protein AMSG_04431 [Thecamonas trahens ATCC 50062]